MRLLDQTTNIMTSAISLVTRIPYSRSIAGCMISPWRTHAALFAPPKTGSTWLSTLLHEGLGWRSVTMSKRADGSEQEMELTRLLEKGAFFGNVLSPHQHCRFNRNTEISLRKGRIKPILLSRNLFDCLVSFRDHFDREATVCSMGYMSPNLWQQLSETEKLDFMVEMIAPWYFNFYASWLDSEPYRAGEICWITYAELLDDPARKLADVYEFLGVRNPRLSPADAVERVASMKAKTTRKNQGIVGRGDYLLSDKQKCRVIAMSRFYPGLDFSIVGVSSDEVEMASESNRSVPFSVRSAK